MNLRVCSASCERAARTDARKGRSGFVGRAVLGVKCFDAVIGNSAAGRVEEIVPRVNRFQKLLEAVADVDSRRRGKAIGPCIESGGRLDGHRLVGAECREYLGCERGGRTRRAGRVRDAGPLGRYGPMMFERVGRIVGRADENDVHLAQDSPGGKIGKRKPRVAFLPDAARGLRPEKPIGDSQWPLQFKMGPMVKRIAERLRDGFGPLLEFLPVRGVAGTETLVHPCGAHRPPFVVVAGQPYSRQILESPVFGDLRRGQMAMVIEDRKRFGISVIQRRGTIAFE